MVAFGERNSSGINPLYFTIDAENSDYQVIWNENSSLPFKDNSIKLIYSSHSLEHLNEQSAQKFFSEAYRVLKTKGELSIEVPDAKFLYNAYGSFLKKRSADEYKELLNFQFNEAIYENIKKVQNIPNSKLLTWLDHFSNKIFVKLTNYCVPKFVGFATPYLIDPEVIKIKYDKFRDINKFFDWLFGQMPENLKHTGGHNSYWYYEKLNYELSKLNFKCSCRGYRESLVLGKLFSKILLPDRKYRGFYSLRISAIK